MPGQWDGPEITKPFNEATAQNNNMTESWVLTVINRRGTHISSRTKL